MNLAVSGLRYEVKHAESLLKEFNGLVEPMLDE